jgi:hypothetical protein
MQPHEAYKLIIQELKERKYRVNQEDRIIEGFPIWFEIEPYGTDRLQGHVTGGLSGWKVTQNKNHDKEAELPFHINMVRHIKIEVDEHLKVGRKGVREMHELMESLGLYSGNPLRLLELFESRGFNPASKLLIPHFQIETGQGKKKCHLCGKMKEWYFKLDEPAHYLSAIGYGAGIYCNVCKPIVEPEIEKALADLGRKE